MTEETPTTPPAATKRRGGQPGNHNARKHGYFSKHLDAERQAQLDRLSPACGPLEVELQKQRLKMAALIENDPLNVRVISAAGRRYVNLQRAVNLIHAMETNEEFREQFSQWLGQYGFVPDMPPLLTEKMQSQKLKERILNYAQPEAVSRSGQ